MPGDMHPHQRTLQQNLGNKSKQFHDEEYNIKGDTQYNRSAAHMLYNSICIHRETRPI